MSEPKLNTIDCTDAQGGHRMAYWEWGDAHNPHVVLCVHGLGRQGRDFDTLAKALSRKARVICPDVAGRGHSDWLKDPMAYQLPFYAADMVALIAQLQPKTLDWVGTSLGGLSGMAVAGSVPDLVRRLVLNDVGPVTNWPAIVRIRSYIGQTGHFETVQQAADAMWAISSTFGPHTKEQWLALCAPMMRALPTGGFTLHYDPAIAQPLQSLTEEQALQGQAQMWQLYDAITADTLVLRGGESDLLAPATALAMTQRGPKAQLVEFAGVGHAPTLVAENQVEVVRKFLLD